MKIFFGSLVVFIITAVLYFSFTSNAKDFDSFLVVGQKFSELKEYFSDNYAVTKSAQDRLTYTFIGKNDNITRFAVKDDIIEVVEVFNVFTNKEQSLALYEALAIYLVADEKCHLIRGYNTTLEFSKGNIFVRLEMLPSQYGELVKFTSYIQ